MSGKFLRHADLVSAKKEEEIFNSMLKRGEIKDPEEIVRTHHVACGCGAPGCVFISVQRKSD
jgi:hypothetical protein